MCDLDVKVTVKVTVTVTVKVTVTVTVTVKFKVTVTVTVKEHFPDFSDLHNEKRPSVCRVACSCFIIVPITTL
jgi:hypothetical protein